MFGLTATIAKTTQKIEHVQFSTDHYSLRSLQNPNTPVAVNLIKK
jgi:hypothetical protein